MEFIDSLLELLANPLFVFFLISCGFFLRVGFLLADWFIESIKLLCLCWKKPR